jgi:hypothetical protein
MISLGLGLGVAKGAGGVEDPVIWEDDFATGIGNWTLGGTAGAGDSISWDSGNERLEVTRATNNISAYRAVTCTIGQDYKVTVGSVLNGSSRTQVKTTTTPDTADNIIGAGTYTFTATATTHYVHLRSSAISTQWFDDVKVERV